MIDIFPPLSLTYLRYTEYLHCQNTRRDLEMHGDYHALKIYWQFCSLSGKKEISELIQIQTL